MLQQNLSTKNEKFSLPSSAPTSSSTWTEVYLICTYRRSRVASTGGHGVLIEVPGHLGGGAGQHVVPKVRLLLYKKQNLYEGALKAPVFTKSFILVRG